MTCTCMYFYVYAYCILHSMYVMLCHLPRNVDKIHVHITDSVIFQLE